MNLGVVNNAAADLIRRDARKEEDAGCESYEQKKRKEGEKMIHTE